MIQKRLERAGGLVFPILRSEGDFQGARYQPQRAFYVYASLMGLKPFTFEVTVYKTATQAATEYAAAINQVHALGGDFRDFKIIRSGRVLYTAATAGAPDPNVPPVPVKGFLKLIAIAKASL